MVVGLSMTVPQETSSSSHKTLAQQLSEGRLPVSEALRYAMLLAENLRKLHDRAQVHGAVTPSCVAISGAGLELLPAARSEVTPYTAPEILSGRPAEAAGDVFSFGSILYEMLSGRQAFDGITSGALSASILSSNPAPLGSPAVDRLIASCLAKDPLARPQRMQKILMELKLYSVAVRKAEAAAAPRRDSGDMAALISQLEARMAARAEAQERKVAELEQSAVQALDAVRAQISTTNAELAASKERAGRVDVEIQAFGERIVARVQQSVDGIVGKITAVDQSLAAISERVSVLEHNMAALGSGPAKFDEAFAGVAERMARLEEGLEGARKQSSELHDAIAEDMQSFQGALKQQASTIESARTAMAQTDDLVERVVEALESLQSTVLEQSEDRALTVN
jgi:predicted  nucleic acid-binding Zn-ribbon protein